MAKVTDLMGLPHSGLVPWAVVGLVTDNVDPDELGRIQVKFPTLHEEPLSFWLRQIAPMGGKERGFYALPEIDDEVMVVFMQGSQDVGVIIGQFWNGVDIPPQECKDTHPEPSASDTGATWSTDLWTDGSRDLAANDRRFWKSRSGHLLLFDDTGGAETVQIWDKDHVLSLIFDSVEQRIILANSGKDLHIRTAQDLYLEAGRDIKWRAARDIIGESDRNTEHTAHQDITMKADMNFSQESGQEFSVTAGMNYTCKANMNATVEGSINFTGKAGATATLQGGATAIVKGGMVMIN